jgi:quercetin dioxygenase-like cupin family protein
MKIINFSQDYAEPIELFESVRASSLHLCEGEGEAHVYCVRFGAGGKIGEHRAGFGQVFLVVEGSGWVSGRDGERIELSAGQGAYFARGEMHAKGSDAGMAAIMIQVRELQPMSTTD